MPRIRDLLLQPRERQRLLLFASVGASGVLVNNGTLWLLVEHTPLAFYLCSFIAIEISIITNFLLNDNLTWRDKKQGPMLVRLARYNTSTAFSSLVVNMGVLLFLKEWVGVHYLLANLIGIGAATITNFAGNSLWTYGTWRMTLPRAVVAITGVSLLLRLALAAGLGPGFDEAYYFAYSLHPSASYFDHPPVVGFLAGFFPYLTGVASPFTIRLGAVLLFTGTGLLLFVLARRMQDTRTGIAACALFNAAPLFLLGIGIMILPDAGLAFFWTAALLLLWRILTAECARTIDWIAAGTCVGLAMLSKYHGVLLVASTGLYVLVYRRDILRTPGPYIFALVAAVVFSPVLVWNVRHDFVSFAFQGGRAAGTSLSMLRFVQALGGQAAYLTPMLFLPLMWVAWRSVRLGLFGGDTHQRFWFMFGTLPVALFLGVSFVKSILPHWTLPGYIALTVPLAGLVAAHFHRRWVRNTVFVSLGVEVLLLSVAYLQVQHGVLHFEKWAERGWIREKDVRRDATLDVHGWELVAECLEEHGLSPDSVFLVTHKWFIGGELCLATQGQYPVRCFGSDPRGFGIWARRDTTVGRDAVCVTTNRYSLDVPAVYGDYFERIELLDSITVERGGVPAKIIYLHHCRNMLKSYPLPF
ncbi:MAG: phospholipid carrier-dependent glycosyltransferase [Chitinivibrionales bacterium]|nr:phospholipid carrier-dependent glycosyltransferase [Chitinivibrionales bacterium]